MSVLKQVASSVAAPSIQAVTSFSGFASGWNVVTGDNGEYVLDDALLAVFGDQATVAFSGAGDQVSFNGPSNVYYDETVSGGGGTIIAIHADVTLTGEDDSIFFDPGDDVLNLSSPDTLWNSLYASSGTVNLYGASLSILAAPSSKVTGRVITVNAVSGLDAVSLYANAGNAYRVNGDDVTVTLNDTTATLHGSGDQIWFVDGSASKVTLDLAGGAYDTVYGAGTVTLLAGAVVSVGGGVLVDFAGADDVATLSYTEDIYDRVTGSPGTVSLRSAQVAVYGGSQTIDFATGDDNAASRYQTGGNWDSVYGDASALSIVGAQANVYGNISNIYLSGVGSAISLYGDYYGSATDLYADDAIVIISDTNVDVIGGGDTIFTDPSGYAEPILSGTDGNWDTVYEQNQYVVVNDAQASIVGGGNAIEAYDASDAVSLYSTSTTVDIVEGGGAVTLNSATAILYGSQFYVYLGAGANSVDLSVYQHDDVLRFAGIGQDMINNFRASDFIVAPKSQFANFSAFQSALAQVGDDAVLTLDANDKATFFGVKTSAISASQVSFG